MKVENNIKLEGEENAESALVYMPGGLIAVRLPQLTDDPTEYAAIARWYVSEGDVVEPEQLLAYITTLSVFSHLPMPPALQQRYRVHRIHFQPREKIQKGEVFITFQILGEEITTTAA